MAMQRTPRDSEAPAKRAEKENCKQLQMTETGSAFMQIHREARRHDEECAESADLLRKFLLPCGANMTFLQASASRDAKDLRIRACQFEQPLMGATPITRRCASSWLTDTVTMRIAMRHRLLMLSWTLLFLPYLARAQSLSEAQAFTLKLYQAYEHGSPDYLGHNATQVFSASLLKLIQQDAAQTKPGEIGALDGDPICDCQDSAGFSDLDVKVVSVGKEHARADVRFLISATAVSVSLDLVAAHGQWRIDDVHTPEMPSLVALLQQDIAHAAPAAPASRNQ